MFLPDISPNTPTQSPWFDPLNLSPLIWLDANDLSGSSVSSWTDRSGNGNDVSQNSSGFQPVWSANALKSGFPGITFDGTDDKLLTSGANPLGSTINDCMIFIVTRILSTTGQGTAFTLSGSDTVRWSSDFPWQDGNVYFDAGNDGTGNDQRVTVTGNPLTVGDLTITSFYNSPTDAVQQIYNNGALLGGDANATTVNTSGSIQIGGFQNYQNIVMSEVIVFNRTINATQRQLVEGYLAHKWELTAGLPSDHPYKTSAP